MWVRVAAQQRARVMAMVWMARSRAPNRLMAVGVAGLSTPGQGGENGAGERSAGGRSHGGD
jgi:hypothetical protein